MKHTDVFSNRSDVPSESGIDSKPKYGTIEPVSLMGIENL